MSRLLKSKVLDLSIILRLFSAFGLFLSVFVVIVAQILHKEGAWLVVATPPFWWLPEKRNTHTGFTNDNKTIMKTITFGIKNGPCETLFFLFLSLSFPFSCLFLYSSFSFSFPFSCPFSFPFSFPFPFLFLSFPFLFLSFSFPFPFFSFPLPFFSSPFPILSFPFLYYFLSFSLSSLMWILWSRCEASAWKNDKRKKQDNVWKHHLKGLGVFTNPHLPYL